MFNENTDINKLVLFHSVLPYYATPPTWQIFNN